MAYVELLPSSASNRARPSKDLFVGGLRCHYISFAIIIPEWGNDCHSEIWLCGPCDLILCVLCEDVPR